MTRTPPANANGHRRRQITARVKAEETHCALCGEPVDKTLTMAWGQHSSRCRDPGCAGCVPHPMRAEVDEIIPRSEGGSPYERANTTLVHRRCNLNKALAAAGHQPVIDRPGGYPISGSW